MDVVGWRLCVYGGENWLLIVLVLSVKKVAKSSAVIEVVGGGGGGQRRELNVLKRLRVSGALLILLWKYEDLAVWTSAEKDESKDWYLLRSDGSFDLRHFLSAALSLVRCFSRFKILFVTYTIIQSITKVFAHEEHRISRDNEKTTFVMSRSQEK